ncbi:T3SS (YopN, CesT) and YbjN peptide-binding chaperone 1 [Actinomadura sp. SCN-SB]|uniref:T3SS (YopN, CesT) and YbjN peptide-binding chaperone 1 n=1 Tax=Actinomadura sp. SCN-SB TaxID=3373092 RepID=UPI0037538FA4
MASREMTMAYVEKILRNYLGVDDLVLDENGDVPIRRGSALYFVRVSRNEPYHVVVNSTVLKGVEESLELYQELNKINATTYGVQAYFENGRVILSADMLADSLQPDELERACRSISSGADRYDDELQARFGGEKTFADDGDDSVDV